MSAMCGHDRRPNGAQAMSRQDSYASSSDGLDHTDNVPGVVVSDGSMHSREHQLSREVGKDWLSPPASPNPSINPFFDEHEQKKTHMVRVSDYRPVTLR